MDTAKGKHLNTLEFTKVLARLEAHTSFSAGAERARALRPTSVLPEIQWGLDITSEARELLDAKPGTTIGGARDVRERVTASLRGVLLQPSDLLDVRDTLVAARVLHRTLTRLDTQFPHLAAVAARIDPCSEIIEEIQRCLDERGTVRDNASGELARIRRELRIALNRVQDKLNSIVTSSRNAPYLQEAIVTQRDGRYVIPLKADFKGRIRGVVHDVSASGATVFIEPLSVVELNNAWRELEIEEQQEIERILAHLSALIAEKASGILQTVETIAELDLHFAKARYAEELGAVQPEIVPFRRMQTTASNGDGYRHPGSTVKLMGARHPLLDPHKVVPIDVVLDEETSMLIITGPNTGGKTVSLKTIGLLTLMAQAGMHIPAEAGSAISPFEDIYADIGDEQSIEQSLSTFSSHLTNIISFLDRVNDRSLVLLDELGAGTDPAEGAALARALLDRLRSQRATTFVATHYPELKSYAQLTPGVCNACVEFDPQTLRPTYRLTVGLPGRSNAFAIALQIGLSEEIVDEARQTVSPETARTEDMLAEIHRLRVQAQEARQNADAACAEAQQLTRELRARMANIEDERQLVLDRARADSSRELETLRSEIRTLRRGLERIGAPLDELVAIEESVDDLDVSVPKSSPRELPAEPGAPRRPIRIGDSVFVQPLNALGQVLGIDGAEAEVQVGPARTRVSLSVLERRKGPRQLESEQPAISASHVQTPGMRLDLRGRTVEEGIQQLERHLDTASRANLPWIHIIHGKGTGALKRGVRERLANHPLVSSYESAGDKEGGEGVTVAKLVQG
ncbi:MAG: endonuclease MutS2 [Chloroflexi bacterium]|nr:endonuclease MutS2 [Chloroflexota bacterium]